MNGSKNFSSRRFLALIALLFGSMVTTMLRPAYGQECDPSWYNPWGAPGAAASRSAQEPLPSIRRRSRLSPQPSALQRFAESVPRRKPGPPDAHWTSGWL